jgi:hypothetical protein
MNLLRLQREFRDQTAENMKHHPHSLSLFTNLETVFFHSSTYARFLTWLANKSEISLAYRPIKGNPIRKKERKKEKREREN